MRNQDKNNNAAKKVEDDSFFHSLAVGFKPASRIVGGSLVAASAYELFAENKLMTVVNSVVDGVQELFTFIDEDTSATEKYVVGATIFVAGQVLHYFAKPRKPS